MHEKEKISSNSEAILGYAKLGFENNIIEKMGSRNTTFPTWNGEFQVGITHSYRSTTPSHQPSSLLSIHFSPTPIKFVEFLYSQVFFIDIFYFKEKLVSPLWSL